MTVREKSNLLVISLEPGEEIDQQMNNIIREYKLMDAKVTGYGYLEQIEYGVLSQVDPVFLTKTFKEGLFTITGLIGSIDNCDLCIMINAVDQDNFNHQGRFIRGIVTNVFTIILEIYKTE